MANGCGGKTVMRARWRQWLGDWSVRIVLALSLSAASHVPAWPQTSATPAEPQGPPAGELGARSVIRFLTDSDYPPFNYLDEDGTLTGFNVDVARSICLELEVSCDIQTGEWDSLLGRLSRGETDAVIASLSASARALAEADFSESYYATPARFAVRKDWPEPDITPETLESQRIAVIAGTSHEAYLKLFFRDSIIVPYETAEAAREALANSEVDALFGDAFSLMFWLSGTSSNACCEFRGGPFADERYFGGGIGIAVRKGDQAMRLQLDKAIARLRKNGRLDELYLRYFPLRAY
ncbi:MAG: transporter substrate-binding domain-containing protein [Hyphomicrobiaceae bacterium]